jgi:8-hydroxy-5-deazaflavin:NADPH oxidoreductase
VRIGILGTGVVGTSLGTRFRELGHDVLLGAREPGNAAAAAWAARVGSRAGTFGQAAEHGEILVNATLGAASVAALGRVAAQDLDGKILLDTANPLDFSRGFPPSLDPVNTDSLGERIQAAFPGLRVVKTLNTVLAHIMVDPTVLPAPHDVFMAGEDPAAKQQAAAMLAELGWPPEHILDLGGIKSSRGTEMYMALWLALDGALGTGNFNICVVRS